MMPLYRRLSYYSELDDGDFVQLKSLKLQRQSAKRGEDIIVAGESPSRAFVVEEGWAIRYQMLDDGRRQILNVLMPGDMFDLQVFVAAEADHSVMAVTDMELSTAAPAEIMAALHKSRSLGLALWWAAVQEEAILRQQIVRNGRRTARERVVHFLLELHRRARIVDEGNKNGFHLPLTQTVIGDALGLSHIHVNRVLRRLTRDGYIRKDRTWIELIEPEKLVAICDFDPSYLELGAAMKRMRFADLQEGA